MAALLGFRFRERMSGPVAAGTDDPRAGAERGRAQAQSCIADLEVSIADLGACVRDPQHRAVLGGSVTLTGVATRQPICDGCLRLYVPDAASGAKLMRYDFGFTGDRGDRYFLHGTKVLHTPRASTHEQVTLYTRIHAGGPDGSVWGAGILAFHLRDLPAFLWSMRTVGGSRLHGLRTFLGFARHELATPVRI